MGQKKRPRVNLVRDELQQPPDETSLDRASLSVRKAPEEIESWGSDGQAPPSAEDAPSGQTPEGASPLPPNETSPSITSSLSPPSLPLPSSPAASPPPPPSSSPLPPRGKRGKIGRIRKKRVLRGPDGQLIDIDRVEVRLLLVQMDPVNQILLEARLQEEGYTTASCEQLHLLPQCLQQAPLPHLVVVDALTVAQQTPYFRKMIVPLLQQTSVPFVISGVSAHQQKIFSEWHEGPLVESGDIDGLVRTLKKTIGPGAG